MTKKQYRELVEKVTKGLLACMDDNNETCNMCPYQGADDSSKCENKKMKADALLLIMTGRR